MADTEPIDEVLHRFGIDPESERRLSRKSEEAERVLGIHGVSVSAAEPERAASAARRTEVERHFRVHDTPTRSNPLHRTVELPKPVTPEVARMFNNVFGRGRTDHESD